MHIARSNFGILPPLESNLEIILRLTRVVFAPWDQVSPNRTDLKFIILKYLLENIARNAFIAFPDCWVL